MGRKVEKVKQHPVGDERFVKCRAIVADSKRSTLIEEGASVSDDEDTIFYPLATLTGQMWKDMGLHCPTRWKHLREDEFKDPLRMSKNSFEKLQPWTQMSPKKKRGLF